MDTSVPIVCGTMSTALFVAGTLPMLIKAARTRDLSSYSLGNIAMSNLGNALNTVYMLSLPAGPLWALHGFNTAATALMLFWYLRYSWRNTHFDPSAELAELSSSPEALEVIESLASEYQLTSDDDDRLVTPIRGG